MHCLLPYSPDQGADRPTCCVPLQYWPLTITVLTFLPYSPYTTDCRFHTSSCRCACCHAASAAAVSVLCASAWNSSLARRVM